MHLTQTKSKELYYLEMDFWKKKNTLKNRMVNTSNTKLESDM